MILQLHEGEAPQEVRKRLVELLKSKKGLFRKMSVQQERAKLRAAYVLRKFPPTPNLLKALRKAARDRSQAVALTAQETLNILSNKKM